MPTKEELTLALTKADAAARAGDQSAAADARKLAMMIRDLDTQQPAAPAPVAKAPPASMAPAAKAPPAPMPLGGGLMATSGGTRAMVNSGGDPLAPVDPVNQALAVQKRDAEIEARRTQQVSDAHAQYEAREAQAASDKFNANYRDSLSPIDRMRYDVSNTVRSGVAAVENATIGQIPGSEQAADFIHEQVVPRAQAVGQMIEGPSGRFAGVPGAITGGLTEWGATTARDPQKGMTEAVDMLEPTHVAARGYNTLTDAGGDVIDGNVTGDTNRKFQEGLIDLGTGTLGVIPAGSFTVSAMRNAARAPARALEEQIARIAPMADDAARVAPATAVPPTRPAPPPVQPQAAAPKSMFSSTGQYSVSTQDNGAFDVSLNRMPDGGAVIMHDKGTIPIAPEFAKGKSDEELLAYYFEPLGFQGATKGGTSQPQAAAAAPQPPAPVQTATAPPIPPHPPVGGPPVAAGAVSPPPAVQAPPVAPALSREEARAADLLIRKLEADGLTMDDVVKIRNSLARRGDSGVYETIGEIAGLSGKSSGANVRGLQMAGGAAPGPLQEALVGIVNENAKKMPDRLSRGATRATGQKAENAVATLDELDQRLKTEATPAYDEAYAEPVNPNVFANEILPVLNTPSGQEAIQAARNNLAATAADLQGRAARGGSERAKMEWQRAEAAVKSIDAYLADPVRGTSIPTTMALDYTKRAFDDVIAKAGFGSDTARIVGGTKRSFADSINQATGGKYGGALGVYEDIKRLEDAFDTGLNALTKKTWELERDLAKGRGGSPYSGGEVEALAMGVARHIEDLIEANSQAALTKLLKDKALKNMATALGSEKAAKQFEQTIRRLAANREWGRRVAGGSDTAMRQAAIKDAGMETEDAVTRVLDRVESSGNTFSLPGVVNDVAIKPIARAGKKIYQQMRYPGVYDEGVNRALVPLIATPMTPKNLDEVIRIVEARQAQKGAKGRKAAPVQTQAATGRRKARSAPNDAGFAGVTPLAALAGTSGGAMFGASLPADSDEERFINALFGAGVGGVTFGGAAKLAKGKPGPAGNALKSGPAKAAPAMAEAPKAPPASPTVKPSGGATYFHGTQRPLDLDSDAPIFLTPDRTSAEAFAHAGRGDATVHEFPDLGDLKVYDLASGKIDLMTPHLSIIHASSPDIDKLRKAGFDAVVDSRDGSNGKKLREMLLLNRARLKPSGAPKKPPVKNGFGGSKLPMEWELPDGSPGPRKLRAIADGFDVDTPLYHGTAADFEAFDPRFRGTSTTEPDGKLAFFFSTSPEIAGQYADNAAFSKGLRASKRDPEYRQARREADEAAENERRALFPGTKSAARVAEAKALKRMQEIVSRETQDPAGAGVLPVYSRLQNPLIVDDVAQYDEDVFFEIITEAKAAGHDGVIFKNANDAINKGAPSSDVYAIFDPSNIRGKFAKFDPAQSSSSKLLAGMADNATGYGTAGGAIAGGAFARDTDDDGVVSASERAAGALGGAITGGIGGAAFGAGVRRMGKAPPVGNRLRTGANGFVGGGIRYGKDPTRTENVFRDVGGKPFNNDPAAVKKLNRLFNNGNYIDAKLPTHRLYATQETVNPGFAENTTNRYVEGAGGVEAPAVVKYKGNYYVTDGHHRVTKAVMDGKSNVRVRLYDIDGDTSLDTPLLDFNPERHAKDRARDRAEINKLLDELFSDAEPVAPTKPPPAQAGFGGGNGPKAPPAGKSRIPGEIAKRATVGIATGAAVNFANDAGAQEDLAPKIARTEQDIAGIKQALADFDKIKDPRAKQQFLKDAGFYAGKIDGNIAGKTTEGMERWKAQQADALKKAEGNLTELVRRKAYQNNRPDAAMEALREYGPTAAGIFAALGLKFARGSAAKKSVAVAAEQSNKLNRLITKAPVTGMLNKADQSRPANLNDLWKKGGAKKDELPFKQDANGQWKPNPNAKAADELFSENSVWQLITKYVKGKDIGIVLAGGADAVAMQPFIDKANRDLAEAEAEWKANPSDETYKKVEDAKNAVMAYTLVQRLGYGVAGGRILGSIGAGYAKARPNIPAAATEQAALKQYIARNKPPPRPRASKASPQLSLPFGGGNGGGGKP